MPHRSAAPSSAPVARSRLPRGHVAATGPLPAETPYKTRYIWQGTGTAPRPRLGDGTGTWLVPTTARPRLAHRRPAACRAGAVLAAGGIAYGWIDLRCADAKAGDGAHPPPRP